MTITIYTTIDGVVGVTVRDGIETIFTAHRNDPVVLEYVKSDERCWDTELFLEAFDTLSEAGCICRGSFYRLINE